MGKLFRRLWTDSEPVEFASAYDLDESVARLSAATTRTWNLFAQFKQQCAVGAVNASRVSLQRVIPMVNNSFKPFFRGRFEERGNRVILTGRFGVLPIVRIFTALWFGALSCFTLVMLIGMITGAVASSRPAALAIPVLMWVGGLAICQFGLWLSRNDVQWLSALIGKALTVPGPGAGATVNASPGILDSRGRSRLPDYVALVLAIGGIALLCQALPIGGIFDTGRMTLPFSATKFSSPPALAACGALELLLAAGIYRRSIIAWSSGFLFLIGNWVFFVLFSSTDIQRPGAAPFPLIFIGMSLVVTALWMAWWYAQRHHFEP